jgi:hypothetical protein
MDRRRSARRCRALLVGAAALLGGAAQADAPLGERAAEYAAERPKTILELQQFRTEVSAPIETARGSGTATLVELNPAANAWLLLTVDEPGRHAVFHIENPEPASRRVTLRQGSTRLVVADRSATRDCTPWEGKPSALEAARESGRVYAPLCDGSLFLRNPVRGSRTGLERTTDFLRDRIWGGEAIVGFVRRNFFRDTFIEQGMPAASQPDAAEIARAGPPPAATDPAAGEIAQPGTLGIAVDGASAGALALGHWYPATGLRGVWVSVMRPNGVTPAILATGRANANALDGVEGAALDYLVAFDLREFELAFSLGTDHPRVGWSPRPPAGLRNDELPGPDGLGGTAPLVATGMIPPFRVDDAIGAFTGGFKREHGAFKYGPLAQKNHGSHYGFIEEGVVLSKLQPGLATLLVYVDGRVEMKTWSAADERRLGDVRYARQNGVALVEPDAASGAPVPGAFVNKWGPGNWSGSADELLRTLRAGACVVERDDAKFLVYGYFSTATPSAMARVFQAYGCRYAMHLDMNALEHTYLALYLQRGDKAMVEHLVQGMAQVDKVADGRLVPRFLGFADNRDFFYLTRRRTPR